ncbi:hypothetical protein QTJ16_003496 [Diplocarpon rosae]|uniref:Fungal N-terminal domain-containing protein n=1 Tax=Diplocarpon rosae TaxID=946125 RepID=A0AAD9T3C3_9HELO|nr:hypothetical protein QTJ16_003496 [Diplocarpon rosae]
MTELSAPTSISAVTTLALKLAADAFDLAKTATTTSVECRQLGLEISLFCSTLKQVDSTISEAGRLRYSICASRQTQHIVDRCWDILMSIDAMFGHPRSSAASRDDTVYKAIPNVSHPETQILRKALEACIITLHILLHRMELARCRTLKSLTVLELAAEEKKAAMITNSLKISRDFTIETIETFEDDGMDCRPFMAAEVTQRKLSMRQGNRLRKTKPGSRFQDVAKPEISAQDLREKTSAWVKGLIVVEEKYSLISLEFHQCLRSPAIAPDKFDATNTYSSVCELDTCEVVGRTASSPIEVQDLVPVRVTATK